MRLRITNALMLGLFTLTAFGQNLVYNPGLSVEGTIVGKVNELTITVTTPEPEEITFAWKKVKNDFPNDWDFSLCDHNNCYIGLPNSGTMFNISKPDAEAGQKGFFKVNILDAETEGKYEMQIYVYDKADIERGDTITFTMTNGTSSVNPIVNKVKLAPNPASSEVSLYLNTPNTNIEIYALNGELVKQSFAETAGNFNVDVSDLTNGLFLIKLRSQEGIKQSRLVIQH